MNQKLTGLLSLFVIFSSITIAATASATLNLKKEQPFELNQICSITGTEYSIIMDLKGTEYRVPFTPMFEREFSGSMHLIDGLLPLGPFLGGGHEVYTGKRLGYFFSGKNSNGRTFVLEKRNPYSEPNKLSLEASVNGNISIEFSENNLNCRSIH